MVLSQVPLAERIRPTTLDEYIGQKQIIGKGTTLRSSIESGSLHSMIFWGPPGVGKTSLAYIISQNLDRHFFSLSAINSGVKQIREVFEKAEKLQFMGRGSAVLFIDEIHRFNKSQQDALLGAVEKGTIVLIGATTENPSFEVNAALLSRSEVYVLQDLDKDELIELLHLAIKKDSYLKTRTIEIKEYEALLKVSGGDGRKLLNALELVVNHSQKDPVMIDNDLVMSVVQKKLAIYGKSGEQHYDIISAFIKSMRGSDPNAAVYWLARMIEGGEDPKFIARRLLIFASEDIGNANPTAMVMANNCFQAVASVGYPECRIILSQVVVYLACSTKSNASYQAIDKAIALVREKGDLAVPLPIRNAPTKLMKQLNYGKDYKYSHSYEGNFEAQEYLPSEISGTSFFEPGNNARENDMRKRLKSWWGEKYEY
jgi:putative ATPase